MKTLAINKWQSSLSLRRRETSIDDVDTCGRSREVALAESTGMQRRFCCEVDNGWKESSLSQGIVIVGPKARTRVKPWDHHPHL
ncbi:unnamed protein product [Brassica oleracea]